VRAQAGRGRDEGRPPGPGHHARHGDAGATVPGRAGIPRPGEFRAGRDLPDDAALPGAGARTRGRRRVRRAARARGRLGAGRGFDVAGLGHGHAVDAAGSTPGHAVGEYMYELSRVRLHSVGPAGARYQDVVLDFSGVGDVVTAPQQDALFGAGIHHADGGPPRRPSPASVRFLGNGGGKSVLIKLIFSVMLPGRRQVVGTTNTRVLEKFVGAKDVAHVVLEWQHVESGQRLITGKASEWRGHVASSDPANLIDSWYCFRPGAEVGLDTLPLTEDGRLLTMSGFHDRMTSLHAQIPELQLFWTRRHHEWTERLDRLGLDTELFRYQRAMNAGEGEAADAFAFNTDEAFVEFLLRAVITEEEPKDLADVVATYADNLAQRGELMTERDFV